MEDSKRVYLKIHGRVQGVFYRATARAVAIKLGLYGWVRNCRDGTVECEVEGMSSQIDKFIAWAKLGPDLAWVKEVEINSLPFEGKTTSFDVVY